MNRKYWLIPLFLVMFIRAEVVASPAYVTWDPSQVTYDTVRQTYVDHYQIPHDNFIAATSDRVLAAKALKDYDGPRDIPTKHKLVLTFRTDLFRDERRRYVCASTMTPGAAMVLAKRREQKRRLVLINVEQNINELGGDTTLYRTWPHLGLLYIGTIADQEGYEVVLWDELVQGFAPMESLVQPGDIVGLSLVTTGIERGVVLAEKAKELGAKHVIAGNDSAIFRANQLLALPRKPIDAVFTGNSLTAVRGFFRQITKVPIEKLQIDGVQTLSGATMRSNCKPQLKAELVQLGVQRNADFKRFIDDAFLVPKFDLFHASYWEQVWSNYRFTYGHKFSDPQTVKNATAHFAQGCTRAAGGEVCAFCTIPGVHDIRIPSADTIVTLAEAFKGFGINTLYNVTDSSYEMAPKVANALRGVSPWRALTIYGRGQGVAQHPQFLDMWHALATERVVINMGQESGDERILSSGIVKSSKQSGRRIDENRLATELIASSGTYLHASFIFGSPGETRETCESTLEHINWMADQLGEQFDTCESDVWWLNFGSPISQLFYDYDYAKQLAEKVGKTLGKAEWSQDFASRREELVVPMETEEAWYHHFTRISMEEARELIARADKIIADKCPGAVPRRAYKPVSSKKNS